MPRNKIWFTDPKGNGKGAYHYGINQYGLIRIKKADQDGNKSTSLSSLSSSSSPFSPSSNQMRPYRSNGLPDFRALYERGGDQTTFYDWNYHHLPHHPYTYRDTVWPVLGQSGRTRSIDSNDERPDNEPHQDSHRDRERNRDFDLGGPPCRQRGGNTASPQPHSSHEEAGPQSRSLRHPGADPSSRSPLDGPSIPFGTAARQLDHAVRRAISYFSKFQLAFHQTSDKIKFHASKDLLNSIWKSQILGSVQNPGHPYGQKSKMTGTGRRRRERDWTENTAGARAAEQTSGEPQPSNGRRLGSGQRNPPTELLSFYEHQQEVLKRMDLFVFNSKTPLSSAPAHFSSMSWRDETTDTHETQQAALALQHKIASSHADLSRALQGMSHEYTLAKAGIRELKFVKQNLITYRRGWDDEWVDNGGADSDEEDDEEDNGEVDEADGKRWPR